MRRLHLNRFGPPGPTEKATGVWADVPHANLVEDIDEHLFALPKGRFGWRVCIPAMVSYWSGSGSSRACFRGVAVRTM